MTSRRTAPVVAALAAAVALPAFARAAAPWSTPGAIPNAKSVAAPVPVFTKAGTGALVTSADPSTVAAASLLVPVSASGQLQPGRPLALVGARAVSYATSRLVVGGLSPEGSPNSVGPHSRVEVAYGSPDGVGTPHTLPGTTGSTLAGLAADAKGDVAAVTSIGRSRTVFLRRAGGSGDLRKVLDLTVSSVGGTAAVAVGPTGDLLVAYADGRRVLARHIGPKGTAGPAHVIGAGSQPTFQPLVDDTGRLSVAWKSQAVDEGTATTPATTYFSTAAPGHDFGPARTVTTVSATGAGHYVAEPGVRLVPSGDDTAVLATTGYDGTHFDVQARTISSGHLGAPQILATPGRDAVLDDVATTPKGGAILTARTNIAGHDPDLLSPPGSSPAQLATASVIAAVQSTPGAPFSTPETVSADGDSALEATAVAVDPATGGAVVGYGLLSPATPKVAVRPAF